VRPRRLKGRPTGGYGRTVTLHLIKLVVGCDSVEDLLGWRREHRTHEPEWFVRTRQTPKRAAEIVEGGGSIYRVFKGAILCRQRVLRIDTVGEGRESRCRIAVDETPIRVAPTGRRPFQGWRYLREEDAPPDLDGATGLDAVPSELALKLREIGAW
jgi:hypothetical protein